MVNPLSFSGTHLYGITLYEALYCRRCRTPLRWYELGESVVLGPEIVQHKNEKIKMIQKGDHVFLRVTSITGVGRSLKSQKLTPCFVGPY